MKSIYKPYLAEDSIQRMIDILNEKDNQFEEVESIPDLSKLTYTNGLYVKCTVLCCDLRKSSELPERYRNPTIARILRSFISEAVAVLTDNKNVREIFIEGDCVWAVIDTPYKADIDNAFATAAKMNSMIQFWNYLLRKGGITEMKAGIGLSYGRTLVVKAGYNGSGINELVWVGATVAEAHEFAGTASKNYIRSVLLSNIIYQNLSDDNKAFCLKSNFPDAYHADVINLNLENYYNINCT